MGYSQAAKQATHDRIVGIAAQRFRARGLRGVGIAEVMKEAGLTVGGFYKHFPSRDVLVQEALAQAFVSADSWGTRARASLRQAVRQYLSKSHRDRTDDSCAFAAFLNEADKNGGAVRAAYTDKLEQMLALVASLLPSEDDAGQAADREGRAALIYSACIGALALSRAVSSPALSRELLNNVADQLMTLIPSTRKRRAAA